MKRLVVSLALLLAFVSCTSAPPPVAPAAPMAPPAPTPDPEAFRATAPEPMAARPYQFPSVTRVTLENGLRVLVAENHGAPLITIKALVRSGADQNPSEHAGLADFTADLLDEGAGKRTNVQIAEEVGRIGGTLTTRSEWDSSEVNLYVLVRNIEEGLRVFSDVLIRPTFPAGEIDRIRKERLTTILQQRDSAAIVANNRFSSLVLGGTPYGNPMIGTEASLRKTTRRELNGFYRSHYVPNNVSLIITGDINSVSAVQLARKYFATWERGKDVAAVSMAPRPVSSNTIYIVDRPQAVQSEIRVGHIGSPRGSQDYFSLVTLNTILGGMFTSRVNLNLREKHGYTYGARSSMGFRRYAGPFVVQAPVRNEVTLPAVQQILAEMKRIRSGDISEEELNLAKNFLMGVFPSTVESASDLADRLAELELYGLPEDYFDRYRERIAAVNADDLSRVANNLVQPDQSVIVVVGKASEVRGPLGELGYPIQVLSIQ